VSSLIINIHGFSGSGNNSKYKWLCENTPLHEIYSPTFDYASENPHDILSHLLDKVSRYLETNPGTPMGIYVVGNSMGGFFARRVNQICPGVTAILINPSLAPFLRLREQLGDSGCQNYLDLTAKYAYNDDPERGNKDKLHVIIGDSDELIDHEMLTKPLLPRAFTQIYTIKGGTHHLDMTPEVEEILRSIITPEGKSDRDPQNIHYWGDKKSS
jgi:predicted esterase YcpF (UPF0227 family)